MRLVAFFIVSFAWGQSATAQWLAKNWSPGAYYDVQGNKQAGYLSWTAPDETSKNSRTVIYFKAHTEDSELSIDPASVHGFIIERDKYGAIDSFILSHNPVLAEKPVLEVLASRNPVKLYRSYSFVMSKAIKQANGKIRPASKIIHLDYYFGPNDSQLTALEENNFYESMQAIMADNAEVTMRIRNKDLEYKDMLTLLYVYRNGSLPPASLPPPKQSNQ